MHIRISIILLGLFLSPANHPLFSQGTPEKKAKIAISVWIGWMPFWVMQSEGIIEKRCQEQGVPTVEFSVMEYTASLSAYQAGAVDGVVATIMDSVRPASNGVPTTAVLVNDFSNGGDGVLFKKGLDPMASAKEKITIQLEEYSVSHYLFLRYLDSFEGKLKESDFIVNNISADNAGKAFLTDESIQAVVTWNPHLYKALENQKGELKFSSRDIPGEIIDMLVLNSGYVKENPKTVQALVNAWYDVMKLLGTPATRKKAIEHMARESGATPMEFERMLDDVELFQTPEKCTDFLKGKSILKTEARVSEFLLKHRQIDAQGNITFDPSFALNAGKWFDK